MLSLLTLSMFSITAECIYLKAKVTCRDCERHSGLTGRIYTVLFFEISNIFTETIHFFPVMTQKAMSFPQNVHDTLVSSSNNCCVIRVSYIQ